MNQQFGGPSVQDIGYYKYQRLFLYPYFTPTRKIRTLLYNFSLKKTPLLDGSCPYCPLFVEKKTKRVHIFAVRLLQPRPPKQVLCKLMNENLGC